MSGLLWAVLSVAIKLLDLAVGVIVTGLVVWEGAHETALRISQDAARALLEFGKNLILAALDELNDATLADGVLKIFEDVSEIEETLVSGDYI